MARSGKEKERKLALELYVSTTKTQKEIAAMVGVSENTLTKWVRDGGWEDLRTAKQSTVAEVTRNMVEIHRQRTEQILEEIRAGSTTRYGDELLKMAQAIEKMAGEMSLSHYLQVLEEFMASIPTNDGAFRRKMAEYQAAFLTKKAHGK